MPGVVAAELATFSFPVPPEIGIETRIVDEGIRAKVRIARADLRDFSPQRPGILRAVSRRQAGKETSAIHKRQADPEIETDERVRRQIGAQIIQQLRTRPSVIRSDKPGRTARCIRLCHGDPAVPFSCSPRPVHADEVAKSALCHALACRSRLCRSHQSSRSRILRSKPRSTGA